MLITTQETPTPRRRSPRQEELLDALEALVLREGFGSLTVGELAARLSCSRSTLYSIAPSKEALFLVVEERLLHRIRTNALARAERELDPTARLMGYIAGAIESIRDVGMEYLAELQDYAPARQLVVEFQRTTIGHLRALIEQGIAAEVFRPIDARIAAEMLDATVTRLQDPRILAETGLSGSEALEHVTQLVTQGLLKSPARRGR